VSGVLLLPKRGSLAAASHRNPWADRPLPEKFLPLPGYAVDAEGKITKTAGTALADILKLPEGWPPA
jgi:hypothetical protein